MTIREAKAILTPLGVTLRKTDAGDFRVNLAGRGGTEATAYYTPDLTDAVETGKNMADSARRPAYHPHGCRCVGCSL